MTPSQQARIASLESWARTPDRAARTAAARAGRDAKFYREARERLGPDATDRAVAEAAEAAKKAHYARMSLAAHAARWGKAVHDPRLPAAPGPGDGVHRPRVADRRRSPRRVDLPHHGPAMNGPWFCHGAGGCTCRCPACGRPPWAHCHSHGHACHLTCPPLRGST